MYALDVYEELKKLKDDPEAFAKRQKEILDEAISNSPKKYQEKLKQQLWCQDKQLNKFKDPTARMNKMIEIFWGGVHTFKVTLKGNAIKSESCTKAKIIPFKK